MIFKVGGELVPRTIVKNAIRYRDCIRSYTLIIVFFMKALQIACEAELEYYSLSILYDKMYERRFDFG